MGRSSNYMICVCVCFLPIHSGHAGGRSHRIFHPPFFCGACLNFSRENDSAIPFPRRPWSQILCTNDLIFLHSLGIFIVLLFYFLVKKITGSNSRLDVSEGYEVTSELPGRPVSGRLNNAIKRFCICSLWSHLNILTFFPSDSGMLRRSRRVLIFL